MNTYTAHAAGTGTALKLEDGTTRLASNRPHAPRTRYTRGTIADNWIHAAFVIVTDAEPWILAAAIMDVQERDKPLTTSRVAIAVQKIERQMLNLTKAPKSHGEYDGTDTKDARRDEYPEHVEDTIARIDSMRGPRGFSGITRKLSHAAPHYVLYSDGIIRCAPNSKIQKFDIARQR